MSSPRSCSGVAIAAALFLLNVIPLAGQTPGRFRVTTREVWHQAAVFDASGRLTVAWSGLDTTGKPGLFARHFKRTGEALGSEMRVSYRSTKGSISVAPLAGGGFAVAWTLAGQGLALRRFDAQGVPLGAESLVAPGDADGAIHALPAGGFVAVWIAPGGTGGQRLLARRYSSTGAPQGATVSFEKLGTGTFRGITVGPGASLLATWEAADTSVCGTIARRYSLDGRPLAPAFSICSARSASGSNPPAVSAAAASFVTVWEGFGGIYMRRLGLNGMALGPTSRVDDSFDGAGAYPNSAPQVALSPTGAFVVLWRLKPCNVDCNELHYSDLTAWKTYAPAGTPWTGGGSGSYRLFCEPGEEDQEIVSGPGTLFAAIWLRTCRSGSDDADFDLSGTIFSAAPPAPPPPQYSGGSLSFAQRLYGVREEQGALTVRVRRTGGTGRISVGYKAAGGTARPGVDYTPVSGRLSWGDGDFADKTFTVPILADGVTDKPSTFGLSLSNPAGGAGVSSASATVYIDSPGFLGFFWDQPAVLESAGKLELQVQRLGGTRGAVSVRYYFGSPPDSDAEPGLATEGEDFLPVAGTLHWSDGDDAPKTISIPILDDDAIENWEGFSYSLTDPTGGAVLGSYPLYSWIWSVIEDDEISLASPGRLDLDAASPLTVEEGAGRAVVSVRRTAGMAGRVSVRYTVTAGTAKPGVDFTPVTGVLVWGDSDLAEHSFSIPILDDHQVEGNETVKIELSAPTGGVTLGIPSAAVLTILDDDR
jgi:hypothetical protein